jgi:hypothetical protein
MSWHFEILITGMLPLNETVCHTDHSGLKNIFIRSLQEDRNRIRKLGLRLSLGLSLALMLSAGLLVTKFRRRRRMRKAKVTSSAIKGEEIDSSRDVKDTSLFVGDKD